MIWVVGALGLLAVAWMVVMSSSVRARVVVQDSAQLAELEASAIRCIERTGQIHDRIAMILTYQETDPELVASAYDRILMLVRRGIQPPVVYMGADGGLSIEWSMPGDWEVSVDFERDSIEGDTTNTTTGASADFTLSASASDDELVSAVKGILDFTGSP